jgi:alanine dehydrogenase
VPRVPVFSGEQVYAAVDPAEAVEAARRAFVEHARGGWAMPPKVYVKAPPDGDFRAMPASGGGYAALKWVTSFPNNPARALPTVTGIVVLSDAETGELRAILDAAAVTALRTGAAAVLAAETLARPTPAPAAVVGAGVNGKAVARTFLARDRAVLLWDARPNQAALVKEELGEGAEVAADLAHALAADIVATVTPGREPLFHDGALHAGQHVSLMGADGPGKAEIAVEELLRARIVCDEWEQASHNGDIAHAVAAGRLRRERVAELGRVLLGEEPGRKDEHEITVFDSTGLAVQDLAVAAAVYERYRDGDAEVGDVIEVEL